MGSWILDSVSCHEWGIQCPAKIAEHLRLWWLWLLNPAQNVMVKQQGYDFLPSTNTCDLSLPWSLWCSHFIWFPRFFCREDDAAAVAEVVPDAGGSGFEAAFCSCWGSGWAPDRCSWCGTRGRSHSESLLRWSPERCSPLRFSNFNVTKKKIYIHTYIQYIHIYIYI